MAGLRSFAPFLSLALPASQPDTNIQTQSTFAFNFHIALISPQLALLQAFREEGEKERDSKREREREGKVLITRIPLSALR